MADEQMERDSPESPSEATPPHVDFSPEMVNQPSPPEDQRVSSSTDSRPRDVSHSSGQQEVSSTSGQDFLDPPRRTPRITEVVRELERRGIFPVENSSGMQGLSSNEGGENLPDEPPNSEIRARLEGLPPPGLPCSDEPDLSTVGPAMINAGLVRAALTVPLLQTALDASQMQLADVQTRYSQEIAKDAKQNIDEEKSDDSNQQFDMDDVSSESKSSPDNVDLGKDSSPESQMSLETSAAGDAVIESLPTPRISVIEETSNSEFGPTANVSLDTEAYPSNLGTVSTSADAANTGLRDSLSLSKTGAGASFSATSTIENSGLNSEISPSKSSTASTDESDSVFSTPERRNVISKRKSPTKLLYPVTKKCAPFPSDDSFQSQSDSLMFTRLEELDIKEDENTPGSSGLASGSAQEQIPENDESEKQESDMEVQETAGSDNEEKGMTKGDSKTDNSESD